MWQRWILVLSCLVILLSPQARGGNSKTQLVLWHNQDGEQTLLLKAIIQDFQKNEPNLEIRVEDVLDFSILLLKAAHYGYLPDILLGPSDTVASAKELQLSSLPKSIQTTEVRPDALEAVTWQGKQFGAPVLSGNHLFLYYNKRLIAKPPRLVEDSAWPQNDPYFFFAFVLGQQAFQLRQGKFRHTESLKLFQAYQKLQSHASLVASRACHYVCLTQQFYSGQRASLINGDWALSDAQKHLGEQLGLAPLPNFEGKPLVSPKNGFALLFPKQGLQGKHQAILLRLVHYFQSHPVQSRYAFQGKRLPIRQDLWQQILRLDTSQEIYLQHLRSVMNYAEQSQPLIANPRLPYVWSALQKGLHVITQTQASPEQVLDQIEQTLTFAKD